MSTTTIAGGEPVYRGGLLTSNEYALSEAGAISGRDSVRNALIRNGYPDGLCFWTEYRPAGRQETQELPVVQRDDPDADRAARERRMLAAYDRVFLKAYWSIVGVFAMAGVLGWMAYRIWRIV